MYIYIYPCLCNENRECINCIIYYNFVLRAVGSHAVVGVYSTKQNFCHPLLLSGMHMKTAHILTSLISLHSLHAFQGSGVFHPTAFYIQLILIYASMVYITG